MKVANALSTIESFRYWLFTDTQGLDPGPHTSRLGRPVCHPCPTAGDRLDHPDELGLKSLQEYRNQMLEKGWCHHQVEHLSTVYDLRAFAYLASRQRSIRLVDHTTCLKHLTCVAYNTDPAAYETQHVESGCDCLSVATPAAALSKIIRRGEVPLISIHEPLNGHTGLEIRVSVRTRMSNYIAVSHVWADGLGNPIDNALPMCQIKKLKLAVTALHSAFKYSWGGSVVGSYLLLCYGPGEFG